MFYFIFIRRKISLILTYPTLIWTRLITINEEYDNTKNGFFRTQKAIQNMQRWLSLTPAGKEAMYKEHEHVFEHNFNHLMKRGKELEKNLHEHIQGVFKGKFHL